MPLEPLEINTVGKSTNSLNLVWGLSENPDVMAYIVRSDLTFVDTDQAQVTTTPTNQVTFGGLIPGELYTIKVEANVGLEDNTAYFRTGKRHCHSNNE